MAKIPVGETIAKSYSFAFLHAPTNFAVAWITLLLPAIGGPLVTHFYPSQFPPPGANPAAALHMAFAAPQMLLMFVAFLCVFAQQALFTREALGLRTGPAWRQNPFGADTWRVVLAILIMLVAFIAIYIAVLVIAVVGGVAVVIGVKFMPNIGPAVRVAAAIAAIALAVAVPIALTYAVLRLGFFLVPIVVAEKQVSLTRAWELARGNMGRIFLVWMPAVLPFLVLDFLFIWWLAGGHLFPPIHAGMKPDEIAAWQRQYAATMQSRVLDMYKHWYLTVPLTVAVSTIAYGLLAAPAAFAYRALTATKAEP
jgi:hypothetical protein